MKNDPTPFQVFYEDCGDIRKRNIRKSFITEFSMSESNFFMRLRKHQWKTIEKKFLALIVEKPLTQIFPEEKVNEEKPLLGWEKKHKVKVIAIKTSTVIKKSASLEEA